VTPGLDMTHDPERGHSFPLGAILCRGGVNFSLFSHLASPVEFPFVKP
jgi:hypothetical protein